MFGLLFYLFIYYNYYMTASPRGTATTTT